MAWNCGACAATEPRHSRRTDLRIAARRLGAFAQRGAKPTGTDLGVSPRVPVSPLDAGNGDALKRNFTLAIRISVLLLLAVALVLAWREFWFLTDDAFITFRYIDHHRRGWGYTWNPPPFAPVEGYSNFLWMVLLEAVWAVTGLPPPTTANPVSLVLSFGALAVAFLMIWRMPLPRPWLPHRFELAVLVLIFVLANRSFVTWTSSGLETALFGFCVALWVFGAVELGRGSGWRWLGLASTGAATAALTRPDGLLLVLSTLLLAIHNAGQTGALSTRVGLRAVWSRLALALAPLVSVPAHLIWRRCYYGMWVPNTFYAKQVSDWPDAGVRYTESFLLEYALWAWLLVAAIAAAVRLAQIERSGLSKGSLGSRLPAALICATFVVHVGFYALVVGGDHFEYRVFTYLVIPIAVSLARLVASLPVRPRLGAAIFGLTLAVGLPIPWIHYARSRVLNTRAETFKLYVPIADAFPAGPLRSYANTFDALQKWMTARHVGSRHQEHKIFYREQIQHSPPRQQGELISWNERALFAMTTVGVPGWALPEVAIIDHFGLNDKVVARNPVTNPPALRLMAHERTPPGGYVECFLPNFATEGARILPRTTRDKPLTDDLIRDCETRFARP
jgi:arabinofuranosyltransferase